MKESEFDKNVVYTLRFELLSGKVLLYPVDTKNKQKLIEKLRQHAIGDYEGRIDFLWFTTSLSRMVIVNADSVARVTFCFDSIAIIKDPYKYKDNFNAIVKETFFEEEETTNMETQLHLKDEIYLPQAIIYHKGKAPDDGYEDNPLQYCELSPGCLESFDEELDGDLPLRQFLSLIDNDGEETFIPVDQIVVMEFDANLIYGENE